MSVRKPSSLPPGFTDAVELRRDWKGTLFRGAMAGSATPCSLLVLDENLASVPGFSERFETLSEQLPSIAHPGLVRCLTLGEHEGDRYILSELAEGLTFDQWMAEGQPALPDWIECLCSVLDALEHVHALGMNHGGVTPAEVLVSEARQAVLTDLGVAQLLGPAGRSARLAAEEAPRTVYPYIAPEVHQGAGRPDHRSDVYSAGVIVYQALTGGLPLGHYDLPSKCRPSLDPQIDTVVQRALAADPARRFQRASELASALRHLLRETSGEIAGNRRTGAERSAIVPGLDPHEMATLTLDSDPPGARVTDLSGAVFGDTPLVLKLPPGFYSFCFRLPEPYLPLTEDVRLIPGAAARIVARPARRSGEVVVMSAPPGAEVLRAGKPVGRTPCTFKAAPTDAGEVLVRLHGHHDQVVKFSVASAERREVNVVMKPRLAVLEVDSEPVGVDVLDEKLVRIGTAPARLHLDAGKRRITFRARRGFEDRVEEVELSPGEEHRLAVSLEAKPGLVEVTSTPSGAQVWRHGGCAGTTSLVLTLPSDEPVPIVLKHPGYRDLNLELRADGGARTLVEGQLELLEVEGLEPRGANEAGFQEFRNVRDGSVLVFIPAGPFIRGSSRGDPDERPQRTLRLSDYYISRTPVTNAQFREFSAATGHRKKAHYPGFDADDQPVVGVDWDDAVAYCEWAGLRLPTEAEWEKAARGFDDRTYPWGDQAPLDLIAELRERFGRRDAPRLAAFGLWMRSTAPVGSYPGGASPYGCLDLSGNVWEWCFDCHDPEYYEKCPEQDPAGPDRGSERVCRGGCWSLRAVAFSELLQRLKQGGVFTREAWLFHAPRLSVTTRRFFLPNYKFNNLGFRVARSHPRS